METSVLLQMRTILHRLSTLAPRLAVGALTRHQPHVGRSLLEIYWAELDDIMDIIMELGEPKTWMNEIGEECAVVEPDRWDDRGVQYEEPSTYQTWAETRGQARGVAYCIAVMTNPYEPKMDDIREEAMERWERRHAE